MATKKSPATKPAPSTKPSTSAKTSTGGKKAVPATGVPIELASSALGTVSGPSTADVPAPNEPKPADTASEMLANKMAATQQLAASMPENANKAAEHGGGAPPVGQTSKPADPAYTASTVQESVASEKLGDGTPSIGHNAGNDPLDRVRVDSSDRELTTNQGVKVADNQSSLKAGVRGPLALANDFVLREKITHFDHERIPERVVHARGSAAHGFFESYEALDELTMAAPFTEAGKRTPVFVRFSTVAGERGSTDTARDVRGFAVKFYTDEGVWDLVGNNMPIFFIQDPMKFPDLVHAVKPEPHQGMPQASSAHDTFWDFVSLMPESNHMLLWQMSDRAIPRSYRTMQGFGVHTFRLVNAEGKSVFCKFHWLPVAGTHSLVWDEAVKISGADPDFHRRDLWESIEAGAFPEYELALQIFTEEQAEGFSFDVLDATKIVPEELVPLRVVGKLTLNRNPDNFFAETEQVAFCTQHVVPGIDFSNDPLLQGRNHSYLDTQITRLGGPNFHEIPINASVAQVHNNQRDGAHRQNIHRGRVAYEPNSLAGGCPFQAGLKGFVPFPQPVAQDLVRGKPEKFADHYTQAKLFWASQTQVEKNHIVAAYRFELTRVQTQAIRERVVSMLANIDSELATGVAHGLGFEVPAPQPKALENAPTPEIEESPALSLFARPGDGTVKARRVAILAANGMHGASARMLHEAVTAAGAVPRFVGLRLGKIDTTDGPIHAEISVEAGPSVLYDAVVLPDGDDAIDTLLADAHVLDFVKEQYRHCKTILALGAGVSILEEAGISAKLPSGDADPGVLMAPVGKTESAAPRFLEALARHRHFERETDPPTV